MKNEPPPSSVSVACVQLCWLTILKLTKWVFGQILQHDPAGARATHDHVHGSRVVYCRLLRRTGVRTCRWLITPSSGRDLCKVTPVILQGVVSPERSFEVRTQHFYQDTP